MVFDVANVVSPSGKIIPDVVALAAAFIGTDAFVNKANQPPLASFILGKIALCPAEFHETLTVALSSEFTV